jgi:hypothetical protein
MAFRVFLSAAWLFVVGAEVAVAQERYVGAMVNDQGNLQIAVAKGDPNQGATRAATA